MLFELSLFLSPLFVSESVLLADSGLNAQAAASHKEEVELRKVKKMLTTHAPPRACIFSLAPPSLVRNSEPAEIMMMRMMLKNTPRIMRKAQ